MAIPTPPASRIHTFEVVVNEQAASGVMRLVIKAPELANTIKHGQFMSFEVPGDACELVRIPVSFSAADAQAGTIETYYAVVGAGTTRMAAWQPGFEATVLGPGGNGWFVPDGTKHAVVVAGGIGITPIIAASAMLEDAGIEHDAVVGAQTADKLLETDTLIGCAEVRITTDDGSAGTKGFVTDELESMLAAGEYDLVMCCGPAPCMASVAKVAAAANICCLVSLERMMTCGFGACNTCNVETTDGMVGACTKGPVFDASKVVVF